MGISEDVACNCSVRATEGLPTVEDLQWSDAVIEYSEERFLLKAGINLSRLTCFHLSIECTMKEKEDKPHFPLNILLDRSSIVQPDYIWSRISNHLNGERNGVAGLERSKINIVKNKFLLQQ